MKRKLTLTDICGYLPHGLAMRWHDGSINTFYSIPNIEYGVPILRQLSDLYNTITHNGKEIVPLFECASRFFTDYPILQNVGITKYGHAQIILDDGEDEFTEFWYDRDAGFITDNEMHFTCNQYKLFDYLHELKVDFRNLIENGLAVSLYDLDKNPYNFIKILFDDKIGTEEQIHINKRIFTHRIGWLWNLSYFEKEWKTKIIAWRPIEILIK